ncbi:uncharacterized protein LOC122924134 [Bufo gargarizans]|uniref:uncharacterized protein LOC122924134 n=1 Tax=Bufo gargarizans TaxID=30331 RepID=UPI001CF56ECD|nr:uncharacterized protein LOC122924134 [Bufo gargarizans]
MKRVVGIFSREDDNSYRFLTKALRSEDLFREVRTFIITNNGFQDFIEEVSRCHCAILYHSKNRGRMNITDVTDSLYDEEVTHLSKSLGKKNVVVVGDDLDSSSSEVKMKILQDQPLIKEMAADLVLFSKADKNSQDALTENLQKLSHILITVSERPERIPRVQMVVHPVQLFYQMVQLLYQMVAPYILMVVGPVLHIYKTVIQWVMMVVGPVLHIYKTVIQWVMMVVFLIQLIYNRLFQLVQVQYVICVPCADVHITCPFTCPQPFALVSFSVFIVIFSSSFANMLCITSRRTRLHTGIF